MIYKRFFYNQLTKGFFRNNSKVVTFHRVDVRNSSRTRFNEDLKVSKEFFEYFIVKHLKEGFEFVSLNDMLSFKGRYSKKIAITLDDGYKDNYYNAFPVLRKHRIPATIYISSGFINGFSKFWWFILDDLISGHDSLRIGKRNYRFSSDLEREKVFIEIRNMLLNQNEAFYINDFKDVFQDFVVDWSQLSLDLAMTWDQLAEMLSDPLIDLGNHTRNHYPMNRLSREFALKEIELCNSEFNINLGHSPKSFSYPFGMFANSKFSSDDLRNFGFTSAVTTRPFPISPFFGFNAFAVDRINVTEDYFKLS